MEGKEQQFGSRTETISRNSPSVFRGMDYGTNFNFLTKPHPTPEELNKGTEVELTQGKVYRFEGVIEVGTYAGQYMFVHSHEGMSGGSVLYCKWTGQHYIDSRDFNG